MESFIVTMIYMMCEFSYEEQSNYTIPHKSKGIENNELWFHFLKVL